MGQTIDDAVDGGNPAPPKGWLKPCKYRLFTTYQLVQDFATIHRMVMNMVIIC